MIKCHVEPREERIVTISMPESAARELRDFLCNTDHQQYKKTLNKKDLDNFEGVASFGALVQVLWSELDDLKL